MVDFDVLIVGAGPTGLTTANYLGLCGVRTLVVERNASTVAEPRAVSIDDETLRTMQAIGLIDAVKPRTVSGYGSRYYSPGQREFARVKPTTVEYGHPRRSAFRQPELEAILRDGLNRFDCVEILFETEFVEFEQNDDEVIATLRDASGATRQVTAQYMAACDGGRSTVRRSLGIELSGSSFEERWLVLDMVNDSDKTPDSIAYCGHRRPAITLPGPDNTRRWEFLIHPHEDADAALDDAAVREFLAPYIGAQPVEIIRKIVYTFHARVADRWADGRVFLLGDAAHLTPPYAGQGMNSGQRDALNFAWKAAGVVSGQLAPSVLGSYEAERRDHAWSLIQMAIQIGWVMVPRNWLHTYGQIAFFRLTGLIPPLRDYFLNMRFKPKPRFKAGLFIRDSVADRDTLVGRMLPQPIVRDETGIGIGLDDVLGRGFALVSLSADGAADLASMDQDLWQRLNVKRVALTAGAVDASKTDESKVVACYRDGAIPAGLASYVGKILLVRPDRYVAAVMEPGQADTRALEEMFLPAGI